ncbi:MAG: protein-L-isoaspartate O-methyltransferase [Lysobacteraceae bacterium]|nr:MAG: protein-L-isoaspartate O-methyltransferase [Xanthomonadaceae bacterium]
MTMNYNQARETMVEQQVRPWDVLDARVLGTLATLPREKFVPEIHRALAYADVEIPLGPGQRMMKPVIEGRTLQALALQEGEEVLEIGTGSGYLAACMGALARDVLSLEIDPALAALARTRLDDCGLGNNVRIENVDALHFSTERRFDAICVTAAVDQVPSLFLQWLRPGGRLFVIHGRSPAMEAVLIRNAVNGPSIESLFETDLPYLVGAAPAPQFVF